MPNKFPKIQPETFQWMAEALQHEPDSDPVSEKGQAVNEEEALARLEAKLHKPTEDDPAWPKIGSDWRNRETDDFVTVKLVERARSGIAGKYETLVTCVSMTVGYVRRQPLHEFFVTHKPVYEADPPVTQSFMAEALKNMRNELYATFGAWRTELLADVKRALAERERAEPVPDDIDRPDDLSRRDYLGPDRSIEAIKAEARRAGVVAGYNEATQDGKGTFYTFGQIAEIKAEARAGGYNEATKNGEGLIYTKQEIEDIAREERDSGFEAGKIAGRVETTRVGANYTPAELETLRSEARQSAVAEAATARAHFMLALQDAASALVDLGTLVIQGPTETNAAKRGSVAIGFRRAAHRIQHGSMKGFAEAIEPGLAAAEKRIKELTEVAGRARTAIYTAIYSPDMIGSTDWAALHDAIHAVLEAKPDTGTMSRG
jgi:hypothetical protein